MEQHNGTKRVGCYIRVSTDNQIENYSIEEQSTRLTAFCQAKGWHCHKLYIDGGFSGGNLSRPSLNELIEDINSHSIDAVLVYKLDRLSRSQKDTLTLIEDVFLANGVDFISLNENFDTSTPFGKAMIGILSVFAQLEKDQITERFTMGRIGRAKNGLYHGGPTPPTGYDYINGQLIVNPYEAMQVQKVYQLFLQGESINSIQRYMHNKYKTKHGNWSSHTLVLNVLRNQIYIGKIRFKDQFYQGQHEPLLDKSTFDKVQGLLGLKLEKNISKGGSANSYFKGKHLLSGLIYCQQCGARYSANHGYYICYSRGKSNKKMILDPNCKNRKWPIEELDHLIIEQIKNIQLDWQQTSHLNSLEKTHHAPHHFTGSSNYDYIDKAEVQLNAQKKRLRELYQWHHLSLDEYHQKVQEVDNQLNCLAQSQSPSQSNTKKVCNSASFTEDKYHALIDLLFNTGELKDQQRFIRCLIKKITMDHHRIKIYWNLTPNYK